MQTLQMEEIEAVYWEDLLPESIFQFRVKDFGPWTVGIDAKGRNLQAEIQSAAQAKTAELLAKMGVK
jgi:L(+)-tartrate dehydratase beta subunit